MKESIEFDFSSSYLLGNLKDICNMAIDKVLQTFADPFFESFLLNRITEHMIP